MTEAEVRLLLGYLEAKAEQYGAFHAAARSQNRDNALFFEYEAKTNENVHRSLLWILDGRDPMTGSSGG
ncbi:MAG: hypothetical protein ACYC4P_07160 [Thermoanaerobaculia bacterium]